MAEIYIAFVDTPGFFAGIIRRVIRQKYIHVALSLDPYLEETYSIGPQASVDSAHCQD